VDRVRREVQGEEMNAATTSDDKAVTNTEEVNMTGRTIGNLILMTVICVVVFWVFMALRPANASSSLANSLKMTLIYRDVCPYGRLKVPHQHDQENAERWAYIPDDTKRQATRDVYQAIENMGIEKFCKWNDDWFDKNWGIPDELEVEREKTLPNLYATVTGAARLSDVKYQFFLTAVNNTDTSRDTEWTCRLSNMGKAVIKEWKVAIPKVESHSRVITTQTVVSDANADTIFCD
jgi:hypothetical protein